MLTEQQMAECVDAALDAWYPGEDWRAMSIEADSRRDMKDAIRAFLRAAEARGFKLVGREPTQEMILAGDSALHDAKDSGWDSGTDGTSSNSYEYIIPGAQTGIFKAMFDAAPGVGDA